MTEQSQEGEVMLQDEVRRLAKAIDYLPQQQASDIVTAILERVREDASSMIADVWTRTPAEGGKSVLELFASQSDEGRPKPGTIILDDSPISLLGWVANRRRPIWVDHLRPRLADLPADTVPEDVKDRISGDAIPNHYLRIYDRTRTFAAIPIVYREQLRGVLSIESAVPRHFDQTHIDAMMALEEPLGILLWKCNVYEENLKQTDDAVRAFRSATSRLTSPLNPYRTGFFARPFNSRFVDLERSIKPAFAALGVRFSPYQDTAGGLIVSEILRQIHAAHFGVVDISGANPNVLIELGVMFSARKPTLIFKAKGDASEIPFDARAHQIYQYESTTEGIIIFLPSNSIEATDKLVARFHAEILMKDKSFADAKEIFS